MLVKKPDQWFKFPYQLPIDILGGPVNGPVSLKSQPSNQEDVDRSTGVPGVLRQQGCEAVKRERRQIEWPR